MVTGVVVDVGVGRRMTTTVPGEERAVTESETLTRSKGSHGKTKDLPRDA